MGLHHSAEAATVDVRHEGQVEYEMHPAGCKLSMDNILQTGFGFHGEPTSRFQNHNVVMNVFAHVHGIFQLLISVTPVTHQSEQGCVKQVLIPRQAQVGLGWALRC